MAKLTSRKAAESTLVYSRDNDKVKCRECGHEAHLLQKHLRDVHGFSVPQYLSKYPGAVIGSAAGRSAVEGIGKKDKETASEAVKMVSGTKSFRTVDINAGAVFGLPSDFTIKGFASHGIYPLPDGTVVNSADFVPKKQPYEFDPDLTGAILQALDSNETMYSWGPSGAGKTTAKEQVLHHLGWPCFRLNMDAQLTREDIIGGQSLENGATKFKLGPLPIAMSIGACLIIDEADMMSADLAPVFQSVLERRGDGSLGTLTIATGSGMVVIQPHPDFRILATGNTNMRGDMTGMYGVSTNVQNAAYRNRYSLFYRVEHPKPDREKRIVRKYFDAIPEDLLDKFVFAAESLRSAHTDGSLTELFTTRTLLQWIRHSTFRGDPSFAAELAFLNVWADADAVSGRAIVQRYFGGPL
jgi:cobaltochelatase CobS